MTPPKIPPGRADANWHPGRPIPPELASAIWQRACELTQEWSDDPFNIIAREFGCSPRDAFLACVVPGIVAERAVGIWENAALCSRSMIRELSHTIWNEIAEVAA